MLVIKKNCKVCKAIQQNKKLMERIYKTSYYIPHSKDSLKKVWVDCQDEGVYMFTYVSLLTHAKKHQHLNAGDYAVKMLKYKAKQAENNIIMDRYEALNAQDAVINIGMEKLENGEMKITADHLLRAAKDKQDAQAKVRDQQLQLAEMVAFYTSGEDKLGEKQIDDRRVIAVEDYDPAIPVTEHTDTRAN